jgi:hypothetical protein
VLANNDVQISRHRLRRDVILRAANNRAQLVTRGIVTIPQNTTYVLDARGARFTPIFAAGAGHRSAAAMRRVTARACGRGARERHTGHGGLAVLSAPSGRNHLQVAAGGPL